MKRFIIAVIAVFISYAAFSQEHMKFKGLDIDGSPEEMVEKFKEFGYTYKGKTIEDYHFFDGVFFGEKSKIVVMTNRKGVVKKISVMYAVNGKAWKLIKNQYEKLEDGLIKKYGKPTQVDKYLGGMFREGSLLEIEGFRQGENRYTTKWIMENGTIGLLFNSNSNLSCIILQYGDKTNSAEDEQQAYDDL